MNASQGEQVKFEGEDANAGFASPFLDLIAAGCLVALAAVVMIASYRLPVPGNLTTAPGLLPFLTALAVGIMAVMLALSARARVRSGVPMQGDESDRDRAEDTRALVLALAVAVYIAALQFLAFQIYFSVLSVTFVLSAFEPVSIIALATIIHASWRGPLWITLAVSAGWTLTLSLVFQKVFQIPLPGGF